MSSDATPKQRKRLTHRRDRQQAAPPFDDAEASASDLLPAGDPGSFIELATKADPTTTRQPSRQREPPRAKGP